MYKMIAFQAPLVSPLRIERDRLFHKSRMKIDGQNSKLHNYKMNITDLLPSCLNTLKPRKKICSVAICMSQGSITFPLLSQV